MKIIVFLIFFVSICFCFATEWTIESKLNGEWKEFGKIEYTVPELKISSYFKSLSKIQKSIKFDLSSQFQSILDSLLHFQDDQIISFRIYSNLSHSYLLTYLSAVFNFPF